MSKRLLIWTSENKYIYSSLNMKIIKTRDEVLK